jgi:hypothetical protein
MRRVRLLLAAVLSFFAANSPAAARDYGLERLASMVRTYYGSGFDLMIPFIERPDAAQDPAGVDFGYLGSVWSVRKDYVRASGPFIYHQTPDGACNPAELAFGRGARSASVERFVYRFQLTATGEITVPGGKPGSTFLKLSAIDAKYVDYVRIDITNTRIHTLPTDHYLRRVSTAVRKEGCNKHRVGLAALLAGDVKVEYHFKAGVSANLALDMAKVLNANLGLGLATQIGESEAAPVVYAGGEQLVFAVRFRDLR